MVYAISTRDASTRQLTTGHCPAVPTRASQSDSRHVLDSREGAEALVTGRSRGDSPCRSDEHLVAPSDCLHLHGKRASRRAARNTAELKQYIFRFPDPTFECGDRFAGDAMAGPTATAPSQCDCDRILGRRLRHRSRLRSGHRREMTGIGVIQNRAVRDPRGCFEAPAHVRPDDRFRRAVGFQIATALATNRSFARTRC